MRYARGAIAFLLTTAMIFAFSASANAASMEYENGSITIQNAPDGAIMLHAEYDQNGVLENLSFINAENKTMPITAKSGDKLFLWGNVNGMKPLCKAVEIGVYNGELVPEATPDAVSSATQTASPSPTPDAVSSATQTEETPSPSPDVTPMPAEETDDNEKNLVVYFSRTGENYSVGTINKGNTSYLADYISEYTGADTFEILAKDPYPEGYEDTKTRATSERNSKARPEYIGDAENFEEYDTVFIGYPIWWGDMPMIVYTFLENHDFSGKRVCPFNTHEGSGNAGTAAIIKSKLPQATVTDYLAVRGSVAQNNESSARQSVQTWLKGLGYLQ